MVVVERNGTIPVQSHKGPGERARDSSDVNKSRIRVVAEIEEGQIEEVDDQKNLSPSEVSAGKEHDEAKLQEVVEDEVASYAGRSLNILTLV